MWQQSARGLTGAVAYVLLFLESADAATTAIALKPPVTAEIVVETRLASGDVVRLRDAEGRVLRFAFEPTPSSIGSGEVRRPGRIFVSAEDSDQLPRQPLPLWGDDEMTLMRLALPAVSAAATRRDSLRRRYPEIRSLGDTLELTAASFELRKSGYHHVEQMISGRLRWIEAARRGDVGFEGEALKFFSWTQPLRLRSLDWLAGEGEWRTLVEDSLHHSCQIRVPREAGKPARFQNESARFSTGEGEPTNCILLMAAQLALRSDTSGVAGSHQRAGALRAIHDRMTRILDKQRLLATTYPLPW